MKVTLINYTPEAVELLLFTKATRLTMSPGLLDEIRAWPQEKKMAELDLMTKTIKSSWEFITLTFLIEGITRATAQQVTRTRNASYAMQSQRVTNASEIPVTNPFEYGTEQWYEFMNAADSAKASYARLVNIGVKLEDARGLLPMNVQCNLVAQYNLRSFSDLIKARKSLRAQGEYNELALAMEAAVIAALPWTKKFFISDKQIAIDMLEQSAKAIGINVGSGVGWDIAKAIDLIRKEE